jgi:hypothetical protein
VISQQLDSPATESEDFLAGDWFGEGSVFDTGEELASALMLLASAQVDEPIEPLTLVAAPSSARPVRPEPVSAPSRPLAVAAPDLEPLSEFQVAPMPSMHSAPPTGWAVRPAAAVGRRHWTGGAPPPQRSGWSIRQSVQTLRIAEDTLVRLREEAAQLTWQFAAAAHRETDG